MAELKRKVKEKSSDMKRGVSIICEAGCPGRLLFLSRIAPSPHKTEQYSQSTQYWTVFTFHTILNSALHAVFTRRALQYSIYRREGIAVQYLAGEGAWAIFPGMRCEASPASPYVNTVRADSAFMIKNANLAFHDPQKFNTKMCDMISHS